MSRKARDSLFKKADFYRLVEAARAKNLTVRRIDITRDGLSLIVGEPMPKDEGKSSENPWDEVLADAPHEERLA